MNDSIFFSRKQSRLSEPRHDTNANEERFESLLLLSFDQMRARRAANDGVPQAA